MSEPAQRRRWVGPLKLVLGLAILGLVLNWVPWRDELVWTEGDRSWTAGGTIEGDWKGERVVFEVESEPDDPPTSYASLRARVGPRLELARGGQPDGVVLSWNPGLPRVFRDLDPNGLVQALLCLVGGLACTVIRWWRLLHVVGVEISLFQSLRLSLLGMFFNIVVPGLTGGDLIKAVLVAREHPAQRTGAFISVFVDRIIGILVLALIATVVILMLGDTFAAVRAPVMLFLAGGVLGILCYTSQGLRRVLRVDAWLVKLPVGGLLKQVDEAVLAYSKHPYELVVALLLSLGNHLCVCFAVLTLGRAFGDQLPALSYFAIAPVGNMASAVPIAPGGWGVGEAVFGYLFQLLHASYTMGVAISITFRLLLMGFGLLGGLFLLLPGGKVDLASVERETQTP